MKGRLENEIKVNNRINIMLQSLPSYVEEFSYRLRGNEYLTVCRYVEHVRGYLVFLEEEGVDISDPRNLGDKSEMYVGKYLNSIRVGDGTREKETSFSYRSVVWTALRHFYDFLINSYGLTKNPLDNFKRPNAKNDLVQKEVMTVEDIRMIIDCMKNGADQDRLADGHLKDTFYLYRYRNVLLFLLLLDTGSRIGGVLELNVSDIDLEKKQVTVTSKGNKTFVHKLTDETIDTCKNWLEQRAKIALEDNQALFITKTGERLSYNGARVMLTRYTGAIDKNITLHTTRRTIATVLYNETHDIELVKDKLGHSSVSTTSRYIQKNDEHIKRADEIGANLIKNAL